MKKIIDWLKKSDINPYPFQKEAFETFQTDKSGLIISSTGSGKTYAAFLPQLTKIKKDEGLQLLYITPLRALSSNLLEPLLKPISEMNLGLNVEIRTSDTSTKQKLRQRKKMPEILITTPESLSILLSYPETAVLFSNLKSVIIDEWHELWQSKRGTLLLLTLSLLPKHQRIGLSATIGNPKEALIALTGENGVLIQSPFEKKLRIKVLTPKHLGELPWSGRTGLKFAKKISDHLYASKSTIIFVNTRAQAEKWFEALLVEKSNEESLLKHHHGSLETSFRHEAEEGLKTGKVRWVIATSSLDLGVDFPLVEEVIQVASPKTVRRMIQRGGRAKHTPESKSTLLILPTNPFDVLEIEGLISQYEKEIVEKVKSPSLSFDVLIQHLIASSISQPFEYQETYKRIKSVYPFKNLSENEFANVIQFLVTGGKALKKYPEYHKLILDNGKYTFHNIKKAGFARLQMGVIPSETSITVQLQRGKKLGTVDEKFIARIPKGYAFQIAGRWVELLSLVEDKAVVKISTKTPNPLSVWQGSAMPLESDLTEAIHKQLRTFQSPIAKEIIKIQEKVSLVPKPHQYLFERAKTKEGSHLFFYPFKNRKIHMGLCSLFSYRLTKMQKGTFLSCVNDFGLEILSPKPFKVDYADLLSTENLEDDLFASVNLSAVAERKFRDIANIGGLLVKGYPGKRKTVRQLQISSHTLFEVLKSYDPDNILLKQAFQEALDEEFHLDELRAFLKNAKDNWIVKELKNLSPFSLPLYLEATTHEMSSESIDERIDRITQEWT